MTDTLGAPDATVDNVPIDLTGLPPAMLIEWLHTMVLIRTFEQESVRLSLAGKIPGGIHSSEGQEAVAVGSIRALGPDDVVAGTHRSHHHALAKGLSPRSVMAELFGKADGCAGGRGGSMHLVDPSLRFYGSNGIVGAGIGLATGAALGFHLQRIPAIALGYVGDGGANTGRTWENVNLAAVWKLPLIVVCENNLYAVETHIERSFAGDSIADRASGFGLPAAIVDGQDVVAVYRATAAARERALAGEGPSFLEIRTYRQEGHSVGEFGVYRTKEEIADWRTRRDPVKRLRGALLAQSALDDEAFDSIGREATAIVADAVHHAETAAWPVTPRDALAWPR